MTTSLISRACPGATAQVTLDQTGQVQVQVQVGSGYKAGLGDRDLGLNLTYQGPQEHVCEGGKDKQSQVGTACFRVPGKWVPGKFF